MRFDIISDIIRDVAELPDRSSPDDWPEAMLVTGEELRCILERYIPRPIVAEDAHLQNSLPLGPHGDEEPCKVQRFDRRPIGDCEGMDC